MNETEKTFIRKHIVHIISELLFNIHIKTTGMCLSEALENFNEEDLHQVEGWGVGGLGCSCVSGFCLPRFRDLIFWFSCPLLAAPVRHCLALLLQSVGSLHLPPNRRVCFTRVAGLLDFSNFNLK